MTLSSGDRLPDFVIIGAMKSATTSLYRWLDEQPEVFMAHPKETRFFTDKWALGPEWYSGLFDGADPAQLLGEASVNYMDPSRAAASAERMTTLVPDARLIAVLRHPVDRMRSHYRHEVQRNREERGLLQALRDPDNPYVAHSKYYSCLLPYLERYPREQVLLVRFEDLVQPPAPAWSAVLRFLGLADRPCPEGAHNVSEKKRQRTRMMMWIIGRHRFTRDRIISLRRVSGWPTPIRRVARLVFTRGGASYERRLDRSRVAIADELLTDMWDDLAQLETWLGTSLWAQQTLTPRKEATR